MAKLVKLDPIPHPVNLERLVAPPITRDFAAKLDGIPPLVSLATQMSTIRWGNTVSYRSSGAIPLGLYRNIINGTAAPKPFTQKVKSSNWGVMEGFAVVDDRLGRSEQAKEGGFRIRPHGPTDLPKKDGEVTLNKFPLKIALRDILEDTHAHSTMTPKYELVYGQNPDKEGILRFHQKNHPNETVRNVIFSINLNDLKADKTPKENVDLIASQMSIASEDHPWMQPGFEFKGWKKEWGNFTDKLDSSFPCSAQFEEGQEPVPIEVYGEKLVTVRDTDLDFITQPTNLDSFADQSQMQKYFEPIDMSHGTPDEMLDASKNMIKLMYGINKNEWKKYDELIAEKKAQHGDNFKEVNYADKMPLVPKFNSFRGISEFAITVGLGSPMELYQAMEINIISQKVLSYAKSHPDFKQDHLLDPAKKNKLLMGLAQEPIQLDDKTRARFFIQHPAENHNHHYTSDRGASVIIHKKTIALAKNDAEVVKYLSSNSHGEHMTLNPQWLGDKPGANVFAAEWTKHYVKNFDVKRDVVPEINNAVNQFITNNPQFVAKELKPLVNDSNNIVNFLKQNPKVNDLVSKANDIVYDKEPAKSYELPPIRMRR